DEPVRIPNPQSRIPSMFIELVESLRCPRPHPFTWLVAGVRRMDGRRIVSGLLGCPTCRAEYPIDDGVADFRDGAASPPTAPNESAAERRALEAAAFLDLTSPGGFVVLAGAWGAAAPALAAILD